jgi:CubicO group peptidase (beta-lactamase class C family)
MAKPWLRITFLLLVIGISQSLGAGADSELATALPEEVGLDSAPLIDLLDYVRDHKIPVHSVQMVRHGRLAFDACFFPFNAEMRHDVASVTKSITSTLIGIALDESLLTDVKQPLLSSFPGRATSNLDNRKRRMTLEDLLTMRAGWDCGFEPNEARLFEMRRSTNWLQFMLDLPMVAEPGTRFAYCSGNPHVLSILLTQVAHSNALAFAQAKLFDPLGIRDLSWPADPDGNNHGWGDQLRPRDMAKIGQLFLRRGRWGDRQIISESWVSAATRPHVEKTVNKDHYGYGWWVKGNDYPGMFEAVGRGGQRINVWPGKDLVLVFTGGGFEPGDLAKFILRAIRSDDSLPANPESITKLKGQLVQATNPPLIHHPPRNLPNCRGSRPAFLARSSDCPPTTSA